MFRPAAPQVAVITPTCLDPERRAYLLDLHQSLDAQTVPFEWLIAPNGPADPDTIPDPIKQDPRVTICPRPKPGAAPARNIAMNQISAPFTCFVDDDDLLPPDSLEVRYQHAVAEDLGWVAGWSADLLSDGTLHTWVCPTPVGRHEAGDVWTYWPSPAKKPPLGHTMLLTRTEIARASGGHGGLWKGEDYVYVMSVTGRSAGELLPVVTYHYRDHEHQMTEADTYLDDDERGARIFAWFQGRDERELRRRESGTDTALLPKAS
ncbi:glycosyltransferase family 2 protein [Streptomyces marianii]|uniref:Glycosyltransferase n=1 Tax=Streptomyces marianii TaxID=1817406 RepID=A0A5R9DS06_9ACTN|nr:glycosyltransferase [Streptomyces marianii]TLQ39397.1 glycosyltransferase [Streptomyces marianii]